MNNEQRTNIKLDDFVNIEEIEKFARLQQKDNFKAALTKIIASLDEKLSEQLSLIIQEPCFKKLESSWQGLQSLSFLPVSHRRVKIKLLDLSWSYLSSDLNLSFDIRHSNLYKKIYSNELDTAGGIPFGLLLVDHKINPDDIESSDYDDLYTLQLLSELSDKSMCPVIMGVDEFFFGDNPKRQLHDPFRVDRILSSYDFRTWTLLRQKKSTRFLHLVIPEYLQRKPYQYCFAGFVFNELNNTEHCLWGNAAYLLTANVIREFNRICWFGFLRSYDESGSFGAIVNLGNDKEIIPKVDIFSEDDGFWAEHGFIPLCSLYLSDQKGFFSNQSVWQAPNDESRVLGMLQTNLMACRFAHYIKAQLREQVGKFDSAEECKTNLERWLQKYISAVDYGEDSVMAKYPLKAFSVQIEKDPQDNTKYFCQIMLQPQYQYEYLDAKVLLSTPISAQEIGEKS